jgi:hypothetical protein
MELSMPLFGRKREAENALIAAPEFSGDTERDEAIALLAHRRDRFMMTALNDLTTFRDELRAYLTLYESLTRDLLEPFGSGSTEESLDLLQRFMMMRQLENTVYGDELPLTTHVPTTLMDLAAVIE